MIRRRPALDRWSASRTPADRHRRHRPPATPMADRAANYPTGLPTPRKVRWALEARPVEHRGPVKFALMNQALPVKLALSNNTPPVKLAFSNQAPVKLAFVNSAPSVKIALSNDAPLVKLAPSNCAPPVKLVLSNRASPVKLAFSNSARPAKLAPSNHARRAKPARLNRASLAKFVPSNHAPSGKLAPRNHTRSAKLARSKLGTRTTQIDMRYDLLDEIARLADSGALTVTIARTFTFEAIQEAAELSRSGRPGGKLILLP